jgi:hypothetical protein
MSWIREPLPLERLGRFRDVTLDVSVELFSKSVPSNRSLAGVVSFMMFSVSSH